MKQNTNHNDINEERNNSKSSCKGNENTTPNFMNNFNLLSIENIDTLLTTKSYTQDYIFFEKALPKLDNININIKEGESNPYVKITNYFNTYGLLHELIQIFNKTKKSTFKYFCKNILEKPELSIQSLADIIIKKKKLNKSHLVTFDFSHEGFFFEKEISQFYKGSDIKNITTCYNNNKISMKILEIFLNDNVIKDNIFLIKLPSIVSIAVIDVLKIITYIWDKTIIFKLIKDSYFKDSFHVICSGINIKKYNNIKKIIEEQIQAKGLKHLSKFKLESLLPFELTNTSKEFEKNIKEFSDCLENLISTYLYNLQLALTTDIPTAYRNENTWKYLDKYIKN